MIRESSRSISAIDTTGPTDTLTIEGLTAGYGQSVVLHDVSIEVSLGSVVCLIGRNGVGKTTLLKAIMGLIKPRTGSVILDGQDLSNAPPYQRARAGLAYVPQGKGIFPHLTVRENLLMGLETGRATSDALDEGYDLFPVLKTMGDRAAGRLSGGQQQQLDIARAMLGRPRVMLLDEPTEGIQPSVIWEIERVVDALRARGDISVLLVEQFVEFAIGVSDVFYLMEKGTIVSQGSAEELTEGTIREFLAV
ncbi:MAG TPA: urea ABC transporter ATP-binding subunit UrtE [Chloroflexota bacterium]